MKVISVNIGAPKTVMIDGKPFTTGIYKKPVMEPLFVTKHNFVGDGQADLVHHGGYDKAICAYPSEHFAEWEKRYHRPFSPGAFGENLTLKGLTEAQACIGDIFSVGTAVIQLSQPRQPCFKLAKRHGLPDLPLAVQQTGRTGFYFRVLQEGIIQQGNKLTLVERSQTQLSIQYVNHIYYVEKTDGEAMQKIIAEPALSESWRKAFAARLSAIADK
ncbi:MOSC domain-containing protein [Parageobacillus thermoglucosidasius]|uniref:MOSC domain-containing protein n=1 Tax=Parageobacillus thermoglucosidasius TaxID=1426 RepID=UPI0027FF6B83|nr:MOSC domain-containing protein [Parageobacillus thermoglucosidasius]